MFGAIIGDIIGSRFEFCADEVAKDFELFNDDSRFTDDTVLTVAVADALMECDDFSDEEIERRLKDSISKFTRRYPNVGYGPTFSSWLKSGMTKPYYSYGNGSAMRVAPVGWYFKTLETTRRVARITAKVSHNHPEGIKGAECVASVIWLLLHGKSKSEVAEYVDVNFGYDIPLGLDQIDKNRQRTDMSCMHTVPVALACFLYADSFEDIIRNAVSLGGDTDTTAAIAGSMAEAYYVIPFQIFTEGQKRVPDDIIDVALNFYQTWETKDDA